MAARANFARWYRRAVIGIPYAWLIVFLAVPFLIVLRIALSQTELAQPPYSPVFDPAAGWQGVKDFFGALSFANFKLLFRRLALCVVLSAQLTFACVSTADPARYRDSDRLRHGTSPRAGCSQSWSSAVILPFWTAFLIRIYAWINILQRDGLLNDALMALGLISEPVTWLATDTAIYIGIVYSYLPFMVLPLYAVVRENGRDAAGGGRRSRLSALEGVLAGDAAACLARRARRLRCFASFRSVGEFVIPGSARRVGCAVHRPDPVDRILLQQGLAGGVGAGNCAAGDLAGPDHVLPSGTDARAGAEVRVAMCLRSSPRMRGPRAQNDSVSLEPWIPAFAGMTREWVPARAAGVRR